MSQKQNQFLLVKTHGYGLYRYEWCSNMEESIKDERICFMGRRHKSVKRFDICL